MVALALLSGGACRRTRLSRGDAASVVVASPRRDAPAARSLPEREPNDSPEHAQLLALNAEWPVMDIEGMVCSQPDQKDGKDVDVFKLVIPGSAAPDRPVTAFDSAPPEDVRRTARRLSLDIATDGGSVSLQLLDEGLKVLESVAAESGGTAGLPNIAVQPGRSYYFRVKATGKSGKQVSAMAPCNYKLSVQLGDFDVADEREPNDTAESAEALAMEGVAELAGFYGWQHDQDFFRVPAPDVASALDLVVDAVEGVTPGLQVLTGSGSKLAVAKGRRGERLALHNVRIGAAVVDAGAPSTTFYVVVKSEAGQNRSQRYVLHLSLGALKQDTEVEPNDVAGNATPVHDGIMSGFLASSDVDYFLYEPIDPREISVEVSFPARVRGKVEISRAGRPDIIASAQTPKARQHISISKVVNLGQPLLLRIAPVRADGNANEPYSLRISSTPSITETQIPEIRVLP